MSKVHAFSVLMYCSSVGKKTGVNAATCLNVSDGTARPTVQ